MRTNVPERRATLFVRGAAAPQLSRGDFSTALFLRQRPEPHFYFRFMGRFRSGQFSKSVKNDFEMIIILPLHAVDFALEIGNRDRHASDLHECTDNLDVHLDGGFTVENA